VAAVVRCIDTKAPLSVTAPTINAADCRVYPCHWNVAVVARLTTLRYKRALTCRIHSLVFLATSVCVKKNLSLKRIWMACYGERSELN